MAPLLYNNVSMLVERGLVIWRELGQYLATKNSQTLLNVDTHKKYNLPEKKKKHNDYYIT
jgi:hypothetical protein